MAPARERIDAAIRGSERFLNAWHGGPSAQERLRAVAEATGDDERLDKYGKGDRIERLESRVAALLGKEAAVFMPSGTMAQQIALRIWSERRGIRTVAFHPTCHLELHEEKGYERLHGLHGRLVGDPTGSSRSPISRTSTTPLAALLLELPQRELGGRLPERDDLVAQTSWARERGVALHLDGARLWEAQPYYGRPRLAGLFDSVYVSFYKGLGGLAGAALASDADTVAEARVWQRRRRQPRDPASVRRDCRGGPRLPSRPRGAPTSATRARSLPSFRRCPRDLRNSPILPEMAAIRVRAGSFSLPHSAWLPAMSPLKNAYA